MSRTPTKLAQAKAARVLRAGGSQAQAARKADRCKRQIQRWLHDPAFVALVRHETLITVGHVAEVDSLPPSTDLLDGLPPSKAWVSVPDRTVLGSALHPLADAGVTNNRDPDSGRPGRFTAQVAASVVHVELAGTPERITAIGEALAAGHVPEDDPDAVIVPLTLAGLYQVQRNLDDCGSLIRTATDFRAFLEV